MKYLFIDIRKSDEAYRKHFLPSEQYKFYNIPMNMIRFNKETIIENTIFKNLKVLEFKILGMRPRSTRKHEMTIVSY